MAEIQESLRRCLAVCVAIGAALGALFGLALLVTAVAGSGTPSSILLGGLGFMLLLLSVLALAHAIGRLTQARPSQNN